MPSSSIASQLHVRAEAAVVIRLQTNGALVLVAHVVVKLFKQRDVAVTRNYPPLVHHAHVVGEGVGPDRRLSPVARVEVASPQIAGLKDVEVRVQILVTVNRHALSPALRSVR